MKSFKNINISTKLGTFLAALAVVLLVNFCSILYFMSVHKDNAAAIAVSGQNRMLTQRVAYLSERVVRGQDVKKELRANISTLDVAFEKLRNGGSVKLGERTYQLPHPSEQQLDVIERAEASWTSLKNQAVAILTRPPFKDSVTYRVSNDSSKFQRSSFSAGVNPEFEKASIRLEHQADPVIKPLEALTNFYVNEATAHRNLARNILLAITAFNIIFLGWGINIIRRYVVTPVSELNEIATRLGEGDLRIDSKYDSTDEFGTAIRNIKTATQHLGQAVTFAGQIGTGNFTSDYKPSGEKDALGHSLLNMRNKLQEVNREDKKRNWATEGLAKFAEIVRDHQNNVEELGDAVLQNLVQYMEANQAALFLVNDDDIEEVHLQLVSVYAWDRKKFGEKTIRKGEGLLGQVWLEKEFLYMTKLPSDFIQITSGLGKATPRTLMVVPLKLNDEVFGILEIASFREYETYERDFLIKLSELIGSTISSAKINSRTSQLLEQSQTHADVMREQEEMMRQTMEEMQATQEEVSRKEKEYVAVIEQLQQTIAEHERRIRELMDERNADSIREEMEKSMLRSTKKVHSLQNEI